MSAGFLTASVVAAIVDTGDLERENDPRPPAEQEQTDTPYKEPTPKAWKPLCTEVDSRDAAVTVVPGDSVYKIAEREMPGIANTTGAAAMVLAVNGISPTDTTIHPGDKIKIPVEPCVVPE